MVSRQKNRAQVHAIVDRLELPDPWNVDELAARIAADRGRALRIQSRPPAGDGITGTIFRLGSEDVIFWRADLSGVHRDHVICHELGHLLCGHLEGGNAYTAGTDADLAGAVAIMLHRQCQYGERKEREAEEIADLILSRVRQRIPGAINAATQKAVSGFGAAMR